MIKKILLLLSLPLLLGSCSFDKFNENAKRVEEEKECVYTNVPYQFDLSQRVYIVSLYEKDKLINEWKVKPEFVYFIDVINYQPNEYRLIDDEFYVKGNSYKLYVYNYL